MLSGATENVLQKLPSPFNGLLREEALFYWLFERGRTIFLSNSGGGWQIFFIYVQNYAGGWLEFHFMSKALPGGLVVQIRLFDWCGLSLKNRFNRCTINALSWDHFLEGGLTGILNLQGLNQLAYTAPQKNNI